MDIERRGAFRWEATVWTGGSEPEPLLTVRSITRGGAKRRASRFVALRERLEPRAG